MASLFHLFPPTIHPMVIHFTIAIIYLSTLAGIAGLIIKKDPMYAKVFFILLTMSILATMAAGVAGVISESYVRVSHTVAPILEAHKRDGEITGVILVAAFAFQALKWLRQREAMRVSIVAFILTVGATIMVSITGHLGGTMVYGHGLGVALVFKLTRLISG
jgi:uncharacterized membrane protein